MSPGPSGDVVPCLQVNGVCMEGKQHADMVAAIKAGGDETRLLVVDVLTDEFFKKCKVVPSEEHLAGGLGAVCATSASSVSPCHQTWGVLRGSLSSGRWKSHHPGAKLSHPALVSPCTGAVGPTWALWGCTLAGFMAWGANRQHPPFAFLHNLD